jgi:hypothetical protein
LRNINRNINTEQVRESWRKQEATENLKESLRNRSVEERRRANFFTKETILTGTILTGAAGFHPRALAGTCGDKTTKLPEGWEMPESWPCPEKSEEWKIGRSRVDPVVDR